MKFYHYPHCPFCQRVRLVLKAKGITYQDIPLSYADVKTPTDLIGSKMLPIIDFADGTVMGESLDLIKELEKRFPEPSLTHNYRSHHRQLSYVSHNLSLHERYGQFRQHAPFDIS